MNTWNAVRLSEVIELQRGHDLPVQERQHGDVPVLGSNGIVGFHNDARYAGPGVTIGRSGVIGGATYTVGSYWPLNTCLFVKNFKGNDSLWVYYWLKSIDFSSMDSGSAQPSLNRNYIAGIPVLLPPITAQKAIAKVLGSLDDKIAANAQLAETLAAMAMAQFSLCAKSGKTSVPLKDLVTTQYGVTTSSHEGPGPKFLRVTDINKKPWIEWSTAPFCTVSETELAKYQVSPGDILVARMADPGKAAFVDRGDPEAVFASYLVRLRALDIRNSLYIYYFLRSDIYQNYAEGAMQGSVQKNMNAKVIVATDISMPEPEKLSQFNEVVSTLRTQLQTVLKESLKLSETRDALLPHLMSGKLSVKDAESVIESMV